MQARVVKSRVFVFLMAFALAAAAVMVTAGHAEASPYAKKVKSGDASYYFVPEDAAYTKNLTVSYAGPAKKNRTSYTIPATVKFKYKGKTYKARVTDIADRAFAGCKKLKTVKTNARISEIGVKAFYGCKNLKTLKMPKSKINHVGKAAFAGCAKLTVVPKLTCAYNNCWIESSAFKNCKSLKSLTIKVTDEGNFGSNFSQVMIEPYAFQNCAALRTVKFTTFKGNSWLTVSKGAFAGCKKLSAVSGLERFDTANCAANAFKGTPFYGKLG